MQSFFQKTIKPFLLVSGAFTMSAILLAFLPTFIGPRLLKIPVLSMNQLFVQHWGAVVFCLGVLMVVAAYKHEFRPYVLPLIVFEKLFLATLVFFNLDNPFVQGMLATAIVDTLISVYLVGYLLSVKN
jgi:hypothetical protein